MGFRAAIVRCPRAARNRQNRGCALVDRLVFDTIGPWLASTPHAPPQPARRSPCRLSCCDDCALAQTKPFFRRGCCSLLRPQSGRRPL